MIPIIFIVLAIIFYLAYIEAYVAISLFIAGFIIFCILLMRTSRPGKSPSLEDVIDAQNYSAEVSENARKMYEEYLANQ